MLILKTKDLGKLILKTKNLQKSAFRLMRIIIREKQVSPDSGPYFYVIRLREVIGHSGGAVLFFGMMVLDEPLEASALDRRFSSGVLVVASFSLREAVALRTNH